MKYHVNCRLSFPGVGEAPGDFHVGSVSRQAPGPHLRFTSRKLYLEDQRTRLSRRDLARDPEYRSLDILYWDFNIGAFVQYKVD